MVMRDFLTPNPGNTGLIFSADLAANELQHLIRAAPPAAFRYAIPVPWLLLDRPHRVAAGDSAQPAVHDSRTVVPEPIAVCDTTDEMLRYPRKTIMPPAGCGRAPGLQAWRATCLRERVHGLHVEYALYESTDSTLTVHSIKELVATRGAPEKHLVGSEYPNGCFEWWPLIVPSRTR